MQHRILPIAGNTRFLFQRDIAIVSCVTLKLVLHFHLSGLSEELTGYRESLINLYKANYIHNICRSRWWLTLTARKLLSESQLLTDFLGIPWFLMKTKPMVENAEWIWATWGQLDRSGEEKTPSKSTTGIAIRFEVHARSRYSLAPPLASFSR